MMNVKKGDEEVLKLIGHRISRFRIKKSMSQSAFAKALKINSQSTISNAEKGDGHKATLSIVTLIQEKWGVSDSYFLEDDLTGVDIFKKKEQIDYRDKLIKSQEERIATLELLLKQQDTYNNQLFASILSDIKKLKKAVPIDYASEKGGVGAHELIERVLVLLSPES